MAENTEDSGQSLNQDAVAEVAQPQAGTNEVSESESRQEPQSGETTASSQTESESESAESMDLDKLEEKLTDKKADDQTVDKPLSKSTGESQNALAQENNKSSRSENRYQQLANENRELRQQLGLVQRQSLGYLAQEVGIPAPPWEQEKNNQQPIIPPLDIEPGSELTPQQYQQHVAAAAEKMAQAKISAYELEAANTMERQQQILQLDESMNYIRQKYPELNPNHPNYSLDVDEMVGQIVESMGQVNPAAIKERVDQVMTLRGQSLQAGQEKATAELAKQRSEAAVIPGTSINETTADLNNIPLDDLEKMIGVAS